MPDDELLRAAVVRLERVRSLAGEVCIAERIVVLDEGRVAACGRGRLNRRATSRPIA